TLALSTLTITELRSGWTKEQANWLLPRLYALCAVVPVTKEIAEQAGIWRQEYKSRGQQLGTPDTVIAATAYLNDYSLVTNNAKDYPMPELKLYKHMREKAALEQQPALMLSMFCAIREKLPSRCCQFSGNAWRTFRRSPVVRFSSVAVSENEVLTLLCTSLVP